VRGQRGRSSVTPPDRSVGASPIETLDGLPSISTDRHVHGPPSSQGRFFRPGGLGLASAVGEAVGTHGSAWAALHGALRVCPSWGGGYVSGSKTRADNCTMGKKT
jgi:hypothetical protein